MPRSLLLRLASTTPACVAVLVLGVRVAPAQTTGTIVGQVTESSTQRPVNDITVSIEGTNRQSVTSAAGRYRLLSVPAGQVTVVVRGIGFRSARRPVAVPAGDTTRLDVSLTASVIQLDEVIVSGTGAQTEGRKLGNTVATISAASLETAPVKNVSEVLSGREPGVVAMPGGGLTGEGAKIRIRGGASLSQSNEPIVYVDGVRVDNSGGFGPGVGQSGGSPSRLDDINPEAIDHIEILKGAAAATLYGTEASSGVIQIFTKRGSAGAPRYDLRIENSMSSYPTGAYEPHAGFARSDTQATRLSAFWNQPIRAYQPFSVSLVPKIYETGHQSSYSLATSGGSPQVTYFVAGRYETENGPFGGRQWGPAKDVADRKQANATLTILPTDKLSVRVNSMYTESNDQTPDNNNNIYGTISILLNSKPELASERNPTGAGAFTTIREAMQRLTTQEVRRFAGSLNGSYFPFASVTLDGTVGLDVVSQMAIRQIPFGWNVDAYANADVKGSRTMSTRNHRQLSFEGKASWNKDLTPRFSSALVIGGQLFASRTNSGYGTGNEFPGPGIEVTGAGAIQTTFEQYLEQVSAGTFFQEQLGFNNFTFLTLGARYDKHSAFGQSAGGAFYPKASISVVPSDLRGWHNRYISTLRVRAAVGRSGLQPGAFDKYTTFVPRGSELGAGLSPGNLGNPNLKPEVSTEWETGFELGVLRDRVALDFTYWDRTVRDALIARQFPPSGGFSQAQLDNIGRFKSHGLEAGVKGQLLKRPRFSIDLFANAAYLHQVVVNMGGAPPIKVSGDYARYVNWVKPGYAPGSFFAPKIMPVQYPLSVAPGCTPSTRDQLLTYFATPRSPDALNVLVDKCGQADINQYIGKPFPDWSGAFGTDVDFLRHFRVSALFEYRTGNYYVHDLTGAFRRSHALIGRNTLEAARVEATLINPASTPEQRLEAARVWATELKALTPVDGLNEIHKADFVRWREASLTYNVPDRFAQRFGARNLGITLAGRNLGIITRYPGADPEMNALGRGVSSSSLVNNFQEGINAWGLPIPRRFSVSIRAGF